MTDSTGLRRIRTNMPLGHLCSAWKAKDEGQWREACRHALLAAQDLCAKNTLQRLQIDYCTMAADFAAKEMTTTGADAVVSQSQAFEIDFYSLKLHGIDSEWFKERFAKASTSEAVFYALRYAYTIWLSMPDETCDEVGNVLMPRIVQLLADCRMFEAAEYYADIWITRLLGAYKFVHMVNIFRKITTIFAVAGAIDVVVSQLFKCLCIATHHQALRSYLEEQGEEKILGWYTQPALKWTLMALSMSLPDEREEDARKYFRATLSGSCVAAMSKMNNTGDDGQVKLCRHAFKTVEECHALREYLVGDVYLAAKCLDLWRALLVKRDRKAVADILQSFWSAEDRAQLAKCDFCRSTFAVSQGLAIAIPSNPAVSAGLVDALFAKPTATLVQWLAELGVSFPELTKTVTAAPLTAVAEHCAVCPSCSLVLKASPNAKASPAATSSSSGTPSITAASSSTSSSTPPPAMHVAASSSAPPSSDTKTASQLPVASSSNAQDNNMGAKTSTSNGGGTLLRYQCFLKPDASNPLGFGLATSATGTHTFTLVAKDTTTCWNGSFNVPTEGSFVLESYQPPHQPQSSADK